MSESGGKDGGLTDTGKARQKKKLKSEHNRKTGQTSNGSLIKNRDVVFVGSKIVGSNEERTPKPREKHFAPSGGGGIGSSRQMEE